ncbi:hypothetical protein [Yinghuangia sp. YIM S10712]|uniref:hypothetical protein n=1 Tax=Yinghuangia sp. YIM S10712 TaxID=3436930 RepID=UPI003F53548E
MVAAQLMLGGCNQRFKQGNHFPTDRERSTCCGFPAKRTTGRILPYRRKLIGLPKWEWTFRSCGAASLVKAMGGLRGAWPGKHAALLLEDKGFSMRDVAVEVIVVGTALRVFIPDLRAVRRWCAAWFVQAGLARLRQRVSREGAPPAHRDGGVW